MSANPVTVRNIVRASGLRPRRTATRFCRALICVSSVTHLMRLTGVSGLHLRRASPRLGLILRRGPGRLGHRCRLSAAQGHARYSPDRPPAADHLRDLRRAGQVGGDPQLGPAPPRGTHQLAVPHCGAAWRRGSSRHLGTAVRGSHITSPARELWVTARERTSQHADRPVAPLARVQT